MGRSRSRGNTSVASTSSPLRISMPRSSGRPRRVPSSGLRSRFARSGTNPGPDGVRGTGAAPRPGEAEVGRIFREESGRSVAALIRVFGDIDVAEDAVQEAFAIALGKWPGDGLPPNPGGWITTTARNRAIDRLRREARGRELLSEVAALSPDNDDPGMPEEVGPVQDDRLRLIFTCCHPALSTEAQVALTLRLLGGASTNEVARSFLVTEPAMAQRLARAKRKIKAARIPYRVPEEHELPDRLRPVLAVVYLVYNTGLTSTTDPDLCSEAIRLARALALDRVPSRVANAARRLPRAARRAGPQTMGSRLDRGGSGDRPPMPSPQSAWCIPAPGRDQRRACGRHDTRADRLVADRCPLRPVACGRPHAGRSPEPRHRHRRGAGRRSCACSGERAGPGQLPPVPRHASRPASPARRKQRGRLGRLRAGSRHGTDG